MEAETFFWCIVIVDSDVLDILIGVFFEWCFFGRSGLSLPMEFSTLPFCQEAYGSQKNVFSPSVSAVSACFANSPPFSKVMDFLDFSGSGERRFMIWLATVSARLFGSLAVKQRRDLRSCRTSSACFWSAKHIRSPSQWPRLSLRSMSGGRS